MWTVIFRWGGATRISGKLELDVKNIRGGCVIGVFSTDEKAKEASLEHLEGQRAGGGDDQLEYWREKWNVDGAMTEAFEGVPDEDGEREITWREL